MGWRALNLERDVLVLLSTGAGAGCSSSCCCVDRELLNLLGAFVREDLLLDGTFFGGADPFSLSLMFSDSGFGLALAKN